ncbi:unnamed protein product [Schistocephalus solidus]|uniref:Uncharacterized protein n=1 Tax=Schistocephalus solidus TaxID=70667 RepID=A0A183SB27_SCHSO|nr:unnamed protein product [Schistocephalus solidus]
MEAGAATVCQSPRHWFTRLRAMDSQVTDQADARVLDLFSKVESRISRTLLCNAAGIAASRLPLPTAVGGGGALNAALRDLSLFNTDLAKQAPPGVVEAMRAVRTQWGEKKSSAALVAAPAFERNIVFKLLSMVRNACFFFLFFLLRLHHFLS